MGRMNVLRQFNFQVLVLINWFTAIQCTICELTLQQDTSAYTVFENSPSIYIPYSCTFTNTTGKKSYLTTTMYNKNFQKLQTASVGTGQTLASGNTREPFAVTLRSSATLDRECLDCNIFTFTLNCGDDTCNVATHQITLTVQNEHEAPKLWKPFKLLFVAPELSGRSTHPISSLGNLDCVSGQEYLAEPCRDMTYQCRSGYSSNWGVSNCGGGLRAFRLNSYGLELQYPLKLSLRASIRNRKFGSSARSWHLIYSYNMPNKNSSIIPTIRWDLLAGKAQFPDANDNHKMVILVKRLCPSCRASHKKIIYRRIVTESNRDFNSLWWEYFQLAAGVSEGKLMLLLYS